jgi:transcriptional regulator with XRE-family HTH domain
MIFQTKLQNFINSKGYTITQIGQEVGVNPTTISRFLKGQTNLNFEAALSIVRRFLPEKESEIMRDYCPQQDLANLRLALEYCLFNKHDDIAGVIIDKLHKTNNRVDKEWATAYRLYLDFEHGNKTNEQVLNEAYKLSVSAKTLEIECLVRLIQMYANYSMRKYIAVIEAADGIFGSIESIGNDYVKSNYKTRISIALSTISVYLDKPEDTRKYAIITIDSGATGNRLGAVYFSMGLSYLYESSDKATEYLTKAIETYTNDTYIKSAKRTLTFVQNLYGIIPEYIDYESGDTEDMHEIAHMYIRKGNVEEAVKTLDRIDIEQATEHQLAFHYYFRGLAEDSVDHFYKSIYYFKLKGSKLYRKLPLIELSKCGIPQSLLDALSI